MKNKVVSVRTGCQFLSKNWPGHVHIKLKGRQLAVISAQHGTSQVHVQRITRCALLPHNFCSPKEWHSQNRFV